MIGSGGSGVSGGGGLASGGQPMTLRIGRVKVAAGGRIEIVVTAPAAGSLTATATAPGKRRRGKRRARRIRYGSASVPVSRAGTVTLSIAPGGRAQALLKGGRALRVTVTIFYRPATGAASARTVTVTARGRRGPRAKR